MILSSHHPNRYLFSPATSYWLCKMPLIEITVERDTLNKEQQLRMAKAIQKTMLEEYKAMKGRDTGSYVIVREVDSETWLATRPSS